MTLKLQEHSQVGGEGMGKKIPPFKCKPEESRCSYVYVRENRVQILKAGYKRKKGHHIM